MKNKTRLIVAGVLVCVLLAAGVGGTIALAQGPTPTPPAQAGRTGWAQLYLQALAQKLGITVDKLQQAQTDAQKDAINQAVKQGYLTQAQADAMLKRMQSVAPGTPGQRVDARTLIANAELDAAAKTFGMTSADLTTALKSKTLLTLAQEKNVDVTKLRTAIADAEKAALDQAVKDNKLTQAQADALKANIKPENIDLTRRTPGFAPGNGFGGFNGRGGQFPVPFGKR